jgi:putative membrane protein insertion efficiency factor
VDRRGDPGVLANRRSSTDQSFLVDTDAAVPPRDEPSRGGTTNPCRVNSCRKFLCAGTSVCKYYPSCSAYAVGAVQQHGLVKGSALTAARLARCHPWARGGIDRRAIAVQQGQSRVARDQGEGTQGGGCREAARSECVRGQVRSGADVVIRALPTAASADFAQLRAEVTRCLARRAAA